MRLSIVLIGIFLTANVHAQQNWQVVGRSVLTPGGKTELITSGAHFGFSFNGTRCEVVFSLPDPGAHSYFQYELDGKYVGRFSISSTHRFTITAEKKGDHTVTIYKTTEAHSGAIIIDSVIGKKIRSVQPAQVPLIEFIGNSITCGAAADASEVACGTGQYLDQHNAYYAYGPRVARAIGADFILSSVSGIGIYRTWNKDYPSMPLVYGNTRFQVSGDQPWDHRKTSPQLISIALGTNDLSRGDGKEPRADFDSSRFVNGYIDFVKKIKQLHPKSRVILLSSAMVSGSNRVRLQNCITDVKKAIDEAYPADPQVILYFFKPMNARGCTGHPNVEEHAILADELTDLFRGLIH